jgi:hypothetical protein
MAKFTLENQTTASVSIPASGNTSIFVDSADKHLKSKDDAGTVIDFGAPGNAITSLTGEVTAAGPGAAAATVTNASVIAKVLTGLAPVAGVLAATDSILQAFGKLTQIEKRMAYGNGSDGDVVISSNTTLVRDMYYNNLEIQVGSTLFTNGFRFHVAGVWSGAGIVDRTGTDATGTGATAALVAGTIGASGAGGAGGTAAGSAGGAANPGIGGTGGTGGATGSAGGAGGTLTLATAAVGGVEAMNAWRQASVARDLGNAIQFGGSGGGGGAGDGTAGGAGGSGGGVVVVAAKQITFTGNVTTQGGDGFQPTAGNRGGGGGGGGGAIIVISEQDLTTLTFTTNVTGGVGASGFGTGASGLNGTNGRLIKVRV